MTSIRSAFAVAAALSFAASAPVQRAWSQSFINLNFEQVVLADPPTIETIFSSVLSVPGWTFSDNSPPQLAGHLGSYPQQFLVNDFFGGSPIEGHYSLYLEEGTRPPDFTSSVGPWIEQTGLIPAEAQSLRFPDDHGPYVPGEHPWLVSLDGTLLDMVVLPGYILSCDVSAFAGAVGTLRIGIDPTFDAPVGGGFATLGILDAIHFSPLAYNVTPEPTTAVLLIPGILTVCFRRRALVP